VSSFAYAGGAGGSLESMDFGSQKSAGGGGCCGGSCGCGSSSN